ncbi:MAG: diguanylate cyclase [Actinomycetota bacterium]|nr:diguanylate cyclase [Actinomycetota bacterium]
MQGLPFGLVMVGLADLETVNRRDGYAAGDEALRTAARTLARAADRCGGTSCRHGGSRLALVVSGTALPEVEQLAGAPAA